MKTQKKDVTICIMLFLVGIISRIPFLEKAMSHWDAPQYAVGIIRYSLINQTPGAPGYPLYIGIGRLFHFFVHDIHLSIVLVSVLFSGIGAVVFYSVGKIVFNRTVGLIASLFFLSAPTIYFLGITANPYGLLPTTAAMLSGIVYLIIFQKKNYGAMLGIVLSFVIGIRPQDAMFLLPLAIFGFIFLQRRQKIIAVSSFIGTFLLWFVPFSLMVGGLFGYLKQILPFFTNQAKPNFGIQRLVYISPIILKGFYLTTTISFIFYISFFKSFWDFYSKPKTLTKNKKLVILFFLIWILPSFLFNVFIRSDHAAHQMAYLSAFIFLAAYGLWKVFKRKPLFLWVITLFLIVFNLFTFFRNRDPQMINPYVSQSYHYSELVKNNIRMPAIVSYIKRYYSPNTTLIESDPEIFRPFTYYLRNYKVFAYSSLDATDPAVVDNDHFGYQWNYASIPDKNHVLTVPRNITTVVMITNNKEYHFNFDNVKKVTLAGNAFIYILHVAPEEKFTLSYHTVKKLL